MALAYLAKYIFFYWERQSLRLAIRRLFFCFCGALRYARVMNNHDCNQCPQCPPENIPLPKAACIPFVKCDKPGVFFRTQVIPAALGSSTEGAYIPQNGMYRNMLVRYEADGAVYIYDSEGIYTNLKEAN